MKNELSLTEKAEKVMLDYSQATGCSICVYDSNLKPFYPESIKNEPEETICPHCPYFPCQAIHEKAIEEVKKKGAVNIYKCNMGVVFWVSPIYTNGSFSGAVRGGGFLQISPTDQQKASQKGVDIFSNSNNTSVMCNSETIKEELKERMAETPTADDDKIQSMAEMMQLCAESLSTGSEDYHEIVRRRAEQQQTITKIIEQLKKQYGDSKPGYPLDKEKALMAALRKGDDAEAKKSLNELLAMIIYSNPDQFNFIQTRITEVVVLISRVEISPAKSGSLSMEINSQNLKLVQEAKTIEELTDIIHTIVDRVTGTISSFRGIPHAAALRKAENFILENYTKKISLKEIADVAGLSPPYFSTIFKEEMGENLSKYLNRLRVEKASRYLLETDMSLSEIAANCCFEDQSWFSKIFKTYTGVSPGKYRNQGGTR